MPKIWEVTTPLKPSLPPMYFDHRLSVKASVRTTFSRCNAPPLTIDATSRMVWAVGRTVFIEANLVQQNNNALKVYTHPEHL